MPKSKAGAGKSRRTAKRVPTQIVFRQPEHLDGSRTHKVSAFGDGHGQGFTIELAEHGVELSKDGVVELCLYPWASIRRVDFDQDPPPSDE
jgi:hypothetical protein